MFRYDPSDSAPAPRALHVIVRPETHERMSQNIAHWSIRRDQSELGRKLTTVERIEIEAAARVDAQRCVDGIIADVLAVLTPRISATSITL